MNNYFKKTLTASRVYLVENIDYDNLRDYLVQGEILPPAIIETIDSLPNRRQQIREMLECLPRRADYVFPTFLVALYKSNQHHIATALYETAINSIVDPNDFPLKGWLVNNIKAILSSSPSSTSALMENNPISFNAEHPFLKLEQQPKDPVENSLPFNQRQEEGSKPMECEDLGTFKGSKLEASSLPNNDNPNSLLSFASSGSGNTDFSSLKKSQVEHSTPPHSSSSSQQSNEFNSVYQMDSTPRGLFCIIMSTGPQRLSGDSFPVPLQNLCGEKVKEGPSSFTSNAVGDILKSGNELQTLFWDLGFYSCLMELEDSTLHPDKLNNIILNFSQLSKHDESNCCALALLGFSADDLHLAKIFSWFDNQNSPYLAGKPKLFLIQVPGEITPSNLMSGVEIPEDAVVVVTAEKTTTDPLPGPGLVSSVVQVCKQMNQSSYSVEDIFSQVRIDYPELKIAVANTLTKRWMVESQPKIKKTTV